MTIKHEINEATKILERLYKQVRSNITDEQWQTYLEEIKQKQIELDGRILEGAELEELAKANLMAKITAQALSKKF
jgi:hypothetical protein